ncbi:hypothetical protein PanWU01x14_346210 [Parasponia andersonii]|uniref:Uncharacterized protein n=1 Tax=Parasponia andersonii TaxID=3476 RepID=A0A2P5ACE1_PARAD|nr:hypothetical protein PanWU01x14_346210 [Parasponia andersonii]
MDANLSNREIGAVVGLIPRSYATWTIERQNRLSEAMAESIPNPGQFGPIQFLPRQLGVRGLEGLPPEDYGRQHTAPDSNRAFNVILGSSNGVKDEKGKLEISLSPFRCKIQLLKED